MHKFQAVRERKEAKAAATTTARQAQFRWMREWISLDLNSFLTFGLPQLFIWFSTISFSFVCCALDAEPISIREIRFQFRIDCMLNRQDTRIQSVSQAWDVDLAEPIFHIQSNAFVMQILTDLCIFLLVLTLLLSVVFQNANLDQDTSKKNAKSTPLPVALCCPRALFDETIRFRSIWSVYMLVISFLPIEIDDIDWRHATNTN